MDFSDDRQEPDAAAPPPVEPEAAALPPVENERHFRWIALAAVIAFAGFGLWSWFLHGERGLIAIAALAVLVQITGKFAVFSTFAQNVPIGGVEVAMPFGPFEIAAFAVIFDALIAVVLLSYMHRFEKLPVIGRSITGARMHAHATLERYPGLRRMAFWGVVVFVFSPLPASGAVTGGFASMLLGLTRRAAVLAIVLGAATTAYIYAALATLIGAQAQHLLTNPKTVVAVGVALVLLAWWAYRHVLRILREEGEPRR